MISNPTNFNHVAHMGPGDGMQVLMDLPLVSGAGRGGAGAGLQALRSTGLGYRLPHRIGQNPAAPHCGAGWFICGSLTSAGARHLFRLLVFCGETSCQK